MPNDSDTSLSPHLPTAREAQRTPSPRPWPSTAEELSAVYGGDWDILRERRKDGAHGDWIAERRRPLVLTPAAAEAGLANTLRAPDLQGLQRQLARQDTAAESATGVA